MADNEIKELLIDLKDAQKETFKRLDELGEKQQNMEKNLLEKIDQVSLAVARIEVEHGEKLEILLDVVTGHTKQISSIKERVEKCEKRLDNHDDKFYVLNSAVQAY